MPADGRWDLTRRLKGLSRTLYQMETGIADTVTTICWTTKTISVPLQRIFSLLARPRTTSQPEQPPTRWHPATVFPSKVQWPRANLTTDIHLVPRWKYVEPYLNCTLHIHASCSNKRRAKRAVHNTVTSHLTWLLIYQQWIRLVKAKQFTNYWRRDYWQQADMRMFNKTFFRFYEHTPKTVGQLMHSAINFWSVNKAVQKIKKNPASYRIVPSVTGELSTNSMLNRTFLYKKESNPRSFSKVGNAWQSTETSMVPCYWS